MKLKIKAAQEEPEDECLIYLEQSSSGAVELKTSRRGMNQILYSFLPDGRVLCWPGAGGSGFNCDRAGRIEPEADWG